MKKKIFVLLKNGEWIDYAESKGDLYMKLLDMQPQSLFFALKYSGYKIKKYSLNYRFKVIDHNGDHLTDMYSNGLTVGGIPFREYKKQHAYTPFSLYVVYPRALTKKHFNNIIARRFQ